MKKNGYISKKEHQAVLDQVEELKKKLDKAQDDWIKEAQKGGRLIAAEMENTRLKHMFEVAKAVIEGNTLAALTSLFTPERFLFECDVRVESTRYDQITESWKASGALEIKKKILTAMDIPFQDDKSIEEESKTERPKE